MEAVLRCERCNKPFDKESTLKRHGYYCRSRRSPVAPKTRSCVSCAKRKARCDGARPACSRCFSKGFDCRYPATARSSPQVKNSPSIEQPDLTTSPSTEMINDDITGDGRNDEIPDISDLDFASLAEGPFEWEDPALDLDGLLDAPGKALVPHHPSTRPFLSANSFDLSADQASWLWPATSPLWPPTPRSPTSMIRSFVPRQVVRAGISRTRNMILQTLKSYPLMMIRDNALPPFIHPKMVSPEGQTDDMEPFHNCMSLLHMLGSGIPGNRKLFWRNVKLECERLYDQHRNLNNVELLAAMQALAIYIFIRLDEGESELNDFDSLLLATVTVLAKRFNDITYNTSAAPYSYGFDMMSWQEWIFKESIRRLCIVYEIINHLVFFEPAALCDLPANIALAPLPARKQLWEASDEFTWLMESGKGSGVQTVYGLARDGEVVRLDQDPLFRGEASSGTARNASNWEDWCSGIDGFGGLVMLAASLVS